MKKIILLLLFSLALAAQDIPWIKSYDEAKTIAQNEGKTIMIMFSQAGCPTCDYMKDVAFKDEALADYIRFYFVPVEIDIYEQEVPDGFRFRGTPTFYFTDHTGKKVARKIAGGAKAETFLKELRHIRKNLKP